jgi:hypothetical protein
MTGTSSTDQGDTAGQGHRKPGHRPRKERFPWQLGVSVAAWLVLGGVLISAALGGTSSGSEADSGSVSAVQGALGDSAASTPGNGGQHPSLYLLIGLVTLLMSLMLLIGQAWSRYVLYLLGLVSVILFAVGGRWEAIASFVLLVIGAVLLLNRPTLRYLEKQ